MRVLVTGSAGYIGSVAVPALKLAGHTVVGYDLGWFGNDEQSTWWVKGDIRDPIIHPGWADVVVHLAGISNDPMGELNPALTHEINRYGTIDFINHHVGKRHVVVSSCAVYGQSSELCTEESKPNPQTTYAHAKADVDRWLGERAFNHAILRLGTVFGPSPNHRLDLVVNRMVYDAMQGNGVTATGNAARPLTHIDDVASAIVWAVGNDAQGIYNIVGENVRMKELAESVAASVGVHARFRAGGADTRDYMASGEKATRAGWSPTHSVAGSIRELAEFLTFAAEKGVVFNLTDNVRLSQLRRLIDGGVLDPNYLRYVA